MPALLDAHQMTMEELNLSFQDLLLRTKNGALRNRELTEGSVTVTNVGDLGSDEVFGIIFPPQVCLIGLGKIHTVAVVDGPTVRPGLVIDITLSADHRVTDGLTGARFLSLIEKKFGEIAPEIDFEAIDLHRPLRDQIEIDSYDFYRIIVKIAQSTGVNIPDSRIPQLANLEELIHYISDESDYFRQR